MHKFSGSTIRSCALATLMLSAAGVFAAAPVDQSFYSLTISNFRVQLHDLNPDDNLTPQITLSEGYLQSFFTSVSGIGSNGGQVTGYLGPYTEAVFEYEYNVTLHAANNLDAFVYFQFDDQTPSFGDEYGNIGINYSGATGQFFANQNEDISFSSGGRTVFQSADSGGVPSFTLFGFYIGPIVVQVSDGTLAPVPEPSTYALMLAGIGAIGLLVRRNRRVGKR